MLICFIWDGGEEFALLPSQDLLLDIVRRSRSSGRGGNALVVGNSRSDSFEILCNILHLCLALCSKQALMEDLHQIEVGVLELDPLAFKPLPHNLLMLCDVLGLVGDFLKHDLHHVHLADGEASHLRQCLLLHVLMARRFELL